MIKENYYRVTEVLQPFSGLHSIPKDILDNAADRGTRVHLCCDALINCLGEIKEEDISGYIESFKAWFDTKVFLLTSHRFYCEKLKITGECDGIYLSEQGLVLVDFKTSSKESKTWALQGAAYCLMAKESGHNIKKIEFVKLDKSGKYPEIFCYDYEEHLEMFLKCLDVYKYFFKPKKKQEECYL